MRLPLAALVAALALCLPLPAAHAQLDDTGFAVDRFEPAERGSEWFVLDSLDMRGDSRPSAGLTASFARRPLVFYDANERAGRALIASQLIVHAGGSVVFARRLRLGLNVPFSPFVSGSSGRVDGADVALEARPALGDMRLSADVRLGGSHRGPITAAAGASVWMPTGNYRAFTSDGKARFSPHILVAGELARFAYGLRLAYNYRAREATFGGAAFGSELALGVALGVRITERLLVGPEVYGATVVSRFGRVRETPVEALLGLHYTHESGARFGAAAGPGLTRGLGSPEVRALVSIGWSAQWGLGPPRVDTTSDRDRDGLPDFSDACPDQVGVAESEPAGCPLPDGDGDGIADRVDSCPYTAGMRSADAARHGCPSQDQDKDGVLDGDDACPDKPGRATADRRTSGCDDVDRDGVFDPVDACPTSPGVANIDAARNGCTISPSEEPAAAAESASTASAGLPSFPSLTFRKARADLPPSSVAVLERVRDTLAAHPEVTLLSVEGHADPEERGKRAMRLSQKRVAKVLAWLTRHGVEPSRLSGTGYGAEQPVESNLTDSGRARNRRVEFRVQEIAGERVEAPRQTLE